MSSADYSVVRVLMRLVATSMLAAALAIAGCTSSDPGGSGGATGGSGGTGGTAGTGGTGGMGGAGGVGGEEPPPPPQSTPVVFDSGGATIKSDQYEMDLSVGGPVGKGKADSPQFMLDYYIPTSPER